MNLVDILTVHHHLHILDKTMDNLEDLCHGLPSFVLRQPVQPLDHRVHFLLTNELPNKFIFIHNSSQVISSLSDNGLTKFSLLCLFGRQRECGEQLHENLDNHLIHGFRGRDLGVDLEAIEEVSN